ncbi:MAG: SDR family oxidoreductase [Deltaproteobacteria bacterium]|nr:SDR family oxidoreductase [Deltaproteobacteria bacterium]
MFSLNNKLALITGGASGIGLAVAKRFVASGARVIIADMQDGKAIAEEFGATYVQLDVSDERQVADTLADVAETHGKLDILINNASIGGLYADMEMSAYNASKFAVVGLSKALALEFGQYKIRVNAVCPGFVDTQMGDRIPEYFARKEGCTPEEMKAAFKQTIALGAYATPDQIADAVAFLAGKESTYITGTALPVAGGYPQAL